MENLLAPKEKIQRLEAKTTNTADKPRTEINVSPPLNHTEDSTTASTMTQNIINTPQPSLQIGHPVPDFTAPATSNKDVQLSACTGYPIVIYFYPKDNTPGCTLESQDFAQHYADFKALSTCIFGVSRDTLKSHENFKNKFNLPFELISDEDEALCKLFDVIKPKNMYGRQVMGIERSTFLIDAKGILVKEWRKVKVENHVLDVLNATKALG